MSASFDANPFGSVQFSAKPFLGGFPPVQQQSAGYVPPLVVKPFISKGAPALLPQQQGNPPEGMQLLANALGIPSLVSFLGGNKKTTSPNSFSLDGKLDLYDAGWDSDAIDPETGETLQMKAVRRLPGFYEEPENPFERSLDIVS